MCEIARKDKIKNTDIQEKLGVAQIMIKWEKIGPGTHMFKDDQ